MRSLQGTVSAERGASKLRDSYLGLDIWCINRAEDMAECLTVILLPRCSESLFFHFNMNFF